GEEILILDGTRRLKEAKILDEALEFIGRPKAAAVLLGISPEESKKRLLARGRTDDREKRIQNRLAWFETEVITTIGYYKSEKRLIEVNGEQSPEKVFEELEKKLDEYFTK
ncbi:MAG: hypothetical protein Q8Q97_01800, partial [bacterium]|nr:hypothetical protein [bacterium]